MTISIGNLFSIFIFTIFLSCFNNTHRFMAKPHSPVYCPQLSAAALVAFDFAV